MHPAPRGVTRITVLHFNDTYEIAPQNQRGGLAEVLTLLQRERASHDATLTTFGGDLISPSLLSSVTKGAHMMDLTAALGIDVAVLGNHEFDFGAEVLDQRLSESAFPWLATNVRRGDGAELPHTVQTFVKQVGPLRVGIIGVLTPHTRKLAKTGDVRFEPPVEAAKVAIERLHEQRIDVVIALTHMDLAEDIAFARAMKGQVHVILGGHDHDPITRWIDGVLIHKAGSDAHWLAAVDIDVYVTPDCVRRVTPSWRMISTLRTPPDPALAARVAEYQAQLDRELGQVVGETAVELDARESTVRAREAALGNLVADAIREETKADVALVGGGGLRSNRVYAAGPLRRKDILQILPFGNVAVKLEITGAQLRQALEVGVGKVSGGSMSGRFPQVSGMTYAFDPSRPEGQRVTAVTVGGEALADDRKLSIALTNYVAAGGDGYDVFKEAPRLLDEAAGRLIATIVMDYVRENTPVAPKAEGRVTRAAAP